MIQNWKQKLVFYECVDKLGLHGLHFQHVTLCERRAWMYLNNINFAQWYDRVQLGTAKHRTSYSRDKSVNGLMGHCHRTELTGKSILFMKTRGQPVLLRLLIIRLLFMP